jgi:uridylate kinase
VSGIDSDAPHNNPDAVRYAQLTYDDVLLNHLSLMDMTVFTLCQENKLPIMVVDCWNDDDLLRAIKGDNTVGTIVS